MGRAAPTVRAELDRLPGLRRFGKLVDLPDAPRPPPDTPAPVRFLPVWDASLLVHCRRAQLLREEHRPFVFNVKTPHSVNTFLVDGVVAGTWRHEKGRVETAPFEPLTKSTQEQVGAEAERLAAFHADR
ncbi:MAG: DNA glycosylase AlkZ-like family protein [Acidimicrobiales bacterium]